MSKIDHLVYTVPDLQTGFELIESLFGVRPVYGGRHLDQGTHNAILNLGQQCYFEIIAPDPDNEKIGSPRWMGVDLIDQPTLSRWALRPDDWRRDLRRIKKINPGLTQTQQGHRKKSDGTTLEWEMSIPLSTPEVEVIPFLLNWKDSVHPTVGLEQTCKLLSLQIEHPESEMIGQLIKSLQIETAVGVKYGKTPGLIATIDTPNGQVVIR